MPVAEFGLAVNRKFTTKSGEDREEVLFVDCTVFGKQAEIINQYCRKGKPLLVEGRLKLDTWEDKQGGGKRSKHSVVVENFQFLGGRDDDQAAAAAAAAATTPADGGHGSPAATTPTSAAPPPAPRTRPAAPKAPPAEPPFGDEQQFKEDDIPF